jgi:hypothetical protein
MVELEVVAHTETDTGAWRGTVPVIPGAMWLDPASNPDSLRIVSPVARPLAYVSVASAHARLYGAILPLAVDSRGFASAVLPVPWDRLGGLPEEPIWVVVSSDARETGTGTTGWPLPGSQSAIDPFRREARVFRDSILLDGMPRAEALERGRRRRARTIAVGTLAFSGLLEALLLFRAARDGTFGLRNPDAWEIAGVAPPSPTRAGFLLVAVGTLVLALTAIGLAVVWKLGG